MTVTTNTNEARDPLTWQACEGAGIGPWFDCGPARHTGIIWARDVFGVTQLFWDEGLSNWADTIRRRPEEGDVLVVRGFRWTVRWSDEAAAERDRHDAYLASVPAAPRQMAEAA